MVNQLNGKTLEHAIQVCLVINEHNNCTDEEMAENKALFFVH